jgi:methionyl-tRNA formyltransferase
MTISIDAGRVLVQRRQPVDSRCLITLMGRQRLLAMDALREALDGLSRGAVCQTRLPDGEAPYQGWPTRNDVQAFLNAGNRFF